MKKHPPETRYVPDESKNSAAHLDVSKMRSVPSRNSSQRRDNIPLNAPLDAA